MKEMMKKLMLLAAVCGLGLTAHAAAGSGDAALGLWLQYAGTDATNPTLHDVIVYRGTTVPAIDVIVADETVWLSQAQMVQLFGRDQSVITRHIRNVFKEGELERESVYAKFAYTARDGKTYQVDYYNLDVVISVGYRVKSVEGVRFRKWATKCLKEIMLGRLRRELMNEKTNRRIDAVEHRLTQVENGLEVIAQQLSEDPEPFLSKDRKMIGFSV